MLTNGTITDVKITDFGSVLNLGSDVTQIHRVGSLAYMSPEQLDGGTIDCRADIYSLGAVLYHLIAGRPLFDAQVQSAMMHQIYNVKPAPLAGIRAGVTEALDNVIQKALAKKPGDRYSDWGEFAQALARRSRCARHFRASRLGRFTLRTLESSPTSRRRALEACTAPLSAAISAMPSTPGRSQHFPHRPGRGRGLSRRQKGPSRRRHVGRRDAYLAPGAGCNHAPTSSSPIRRRRSRSLPIADAVTQHAHLFPTRSSGALRGCTRRRSAGASASDLLGPLTRPARPLSALCAPPRAVWSIPPACACAWLRTSVGGRS